MKIKKWNGSAWVQDYPEVNVSSIVATGTPSSTTFLRGDGTWATPAGVDNYVNTTGDSMTGNLIISNGGRIGIGVASPQVALDIAGDMYVNKIFDRNNGNYYVDPHSHSVLNTVNVQRLEVEGAIFNVGTDSLVMPMVRGGHYNTNTGSVTGAIEITLPSGTYANATMMNFFVDVFDYAGGSDGESFTLHIGGYIYTDGTWREVFANLISGRTDRFFNVKFNYNSATSQQIIYIGETTSTWSYPKVTIRDFSAGFTGADDADWYNNAFNIAFATTLLGTTYINKNAENVASYALDADKLDDLQATQFVRSDASDTMSGDYRIESGSFASLILDRPTTGGGSIVQFENNNGVIGGIGAYTDDGLQFRTKDGTQMVIDASNNVGIGTESPQQKLQVNGDVTIDRDATGSGATLTLANGTEVAGNYSSLMFGNVNAHNNYRKGGIAYRTDGTGYGRGDMYFLQRTDATSTNADLSNHAMVIKNDGKVGIGTTSPTQKLDVAGNIAVSGTVDGVDIAALNTSVSGKVNKSGDTMTGTLTASGGINGLTLTNGISGSNFNITGVNQLSINDPGEGIVFGGGSSGDIVLSIVDDANDNILRLAGTNAVLQVNTNTVWHAGNDGTGSTLDADLLDGNHASAFSLTSHTHALNDLSDVSGTPSNGQVLKYSTIAGGWIPQDDVDTNTNTYVTSAAFSTANGELTLTRNDAGTVVVDLDGRFLNQAGGTLTGDLTIVNADPQLTLSDNTAGSPTGDDFSLFVNGGEFNITTDNTGVAQPLELRNLSEKGYVYGDEISVVGHTHTLANITDSGAAAAKGVIDSASPAAIGTGTNLPTERDVYYGLVAVNGASQTRATTIYAPTSAGTSGQVLTSTGGTPSWGSIPGQLEQIRSTAATATFTGSATVITVNLDSGKSVSTTETILMEVDIVNPSTSSAYEKAYVMMRLGSNQSSTNTPMASWSTLDSSASGNPRLWSMLIRYNTSTSLQLRYGGYMLSTNLNSKTYGTVYVQRIWKVTV